MSISVVIPTLDENPEDLKRVVGQIAVGDVKEVVVVDDCSTNPVRLSEAKVIRNDKRLGSAASRAIGIANASSEIIVTTDAHIRFRTPQWGQHIAEFLSANPKTVICPVCVPAGDVTFRGRIYGGNLDVFSVKNNNAILFESRWNTSPKSQVECVMGGAYAFLASWYRKIDGYAGIKGWCPTELASISLKTRLAGGCCQVLTKVELEHQFRKTPPYKPGTDYSTYNKIRLAMSVLPPETATLVPTFLAKTGGIKEIMEAFLADWGEISKESEAFQKLCLPNLKEAMQKAGIRLGIDTSIRKIGE